MKTSWRRFVAIGVITHNTAMSNSRELSYIRHKTGEPDARAGEPLSA
jgi:hypothetical protein